MPLFLFKIQSIYSIFILQHLHRTKLAPDKPNKLAYSSSHFLIFWNIVQWSNIFSVFSIRAGVQTTVHATATW